jgi:hypothetical protein
MPSGKRSRSNNATEKGYGMKHTKEQVERFIASMRRKYRNGLLSAEKIAQREAIPGWRGDTTATQQ